MNRTKIEWTDYTWNPITGCLHNCPYCYARKMAYRLRGRYGYPKEDPFKPTFHEDRLTEPCQIKTPSKIFTVSMGDMFGSWVPRHWVDKILGIMWTCHHWRHGHVFQVLTKAPQNIHIFIEQFPPNLWLGVTVESPNSEWRMNHILDPTLRKKGLKVRWVSIEPLHGPVRLREDLDWVVIGAETGNRRGKKVPEKWWIEAILKQAEGLGIPVFMKDNIYPYWKEPLLQEFPEGVIP